MTQRDHPLRRLCAGGGYSPSAILSALEPTFCGWRSPLRCRARIWDVLRCQSQPTR